MTSTPPFVEVDGLTKRFALGGPPWRRRYLMAVDDVHLTIQRGETLGLVGESGSGKSTLGRLILHLLKPEAGSIHIDGQDVGAASGAARHAFRRSAQMIFQDPYASLNPKMRVGDIVGEPLHIFGLAHGGVAKARVDAMLARCGLGSDMRNRLPHALSGGQRQRVAIARALVTKPSFIVADEPVSALDVSIQAQIINLLVDLQREMQLTCLFISHDLAVVHHIADRVAVMYFGRLVEIAPARALYQRPRHPYTAALIAAVPSPDPDVGDPVPLSGDVPSVASLPTGCRFHPRCAHARFPRCATEDPALHEIDVEHAVACHFPLLHAAEPMHP